MSEPRRIVFFSSGSWEGNASMVRPREFGRALIKRGVNVCFIVDDCEYNRTRLDLDPKAEVIFNPRPGGIAQLWTRRKAVREAGGDWVHVMNPAEKTAAALMGSGFRVVGDWDEWRAYHQYPILKRMSAKLLDYWLRHRARRAIVASRYMQNEFRRRYGLEAAYIPYATYLPEHPSTSSPFDEPTAVFMGNLFPSYDHDLIFEAMVQLKAAGKMPRMAVLGMGSDLLKWRNFVKECGLTNVDVPGYTVGLELWRRLRHAHVLLFPIRPNIVNVSRCPSKTFAYAQARRPVITCRVGEVPEVLGEKARYVEPTVEAFAEAIDQAMSSPQPDVDYGVERHNWGARAEALLEAIGSVQK